MEIIGKIKGYSFCKIDQKKLNDDSFFEEIIKKEKTLKKEVERVITEKGIVCGFKKNKKLKVLYVFERIPEGKKYVLKCIKEIYTDEITEDLQEKLDEIIIEALKEDIGIGALGLNEYKKAYFKEVEVIPKTSKILKSDIMEAVLILAFWIFLGMFVFDDFFWGLIMGICFGTSSGAVVVGTTIKRRKNKSKSKVSKKENIEN